MSAGCACLRAWLRVTAAACVAASGVAASGEWDARPHLRQVGKAALASCAAAERVARAANAVARKELDMERASTLERLADELGHAHQAQLLRVISLACTSGGCVVASAMGDGRPACLHACLPGRLA